MYCMMCIALSFLHGKGTRIETMLEELQLLRHVVVVVVMRCPRLIRCSPWRARAKGGFLVLDLRISPLFPNYARIRGG